MSVLILGGTAEARALAAALDGTGVAVVSSLAGRVERPRLPVGDVRIGGFGGAGGLADYLADKSIDAVVDATHPFAARISANAVAACAPAGVPLLRLARPGWSTHPGAARWHWVDSHDEAAALAARLGTRIWLTTGRQPLGSFTGPLAGAEVVVRVVDPPDVELPAQWEVILDRGPYAYDAERDLLVLRRIEVVVTKDSGGEHTQPKLEAADALGVEVIVVRRPPWPGDQAAVVDTVDQAERWVLKQSRAQVAAPERPAHAHGDRERGDSDR